MIGLEFVCINKNIQYKDLANQLGIGKQNITNWVVGRSKIPHKHLEKLSEILGIAGEWLQKELTENEKVQMLFTLKDYTEESLKTDKTKERYEADKIKNVVIGNIESYFDKWLEKYDLSTIEVNSLMIQMLLDILNEDLIGIEVIQKVLTAMSLSNKDKNDFNIFYSEKSNFIQIIKSLIEEEDKKDIDLMLMDELIVNNDLLKEAEIELLKKNNLLELDIEDQIKKLRQYDDKCNSLANKLDLLNKLLK
ncbi:helix-turn-helix domain-containing protein [Clostridium perfringens]|uniref:helix-turn-helix domain-containing protein n=1 Tax=Clostridium perfringens TaxID=1502 RepID=UPI0028CCFC6D|nr:helix-turn-helix domain-containing protein [Clostridium perfringens]MDT7980820.1 helix-turn-helix domain-containing protein [Clostridium perfringens]